MLDLLCNTSIFTESLTKQAKLKETVMSSMKTY